MFDGLPAGRRRITIIDGADAAEIMVFVNPGRVTETGFDEIELPLRRGVAWLTVDPHIPGLPVYVDDAFIGTTPIVDQPIPVG